MDDRAAAAGTAEMKDVTERDDRPTSKRFFSRAGWVGVVIAWLLAWFYAALVGMGATWTAADNLRDEADAGASTLSAVLIVLPVVFVLGRVVYVLWWNVHHGVRLVSLKTEAAFVALLTGVATLVLSNLALGPQRGWIGLLLSVAVAIVVHRQYLRHRSGDIVNTPGAH